MLPKLADKPVFVSVAPPPSIPALDHGTELAPTAHDAADVFEAPSQYMPSLARRLSMSRLPYLQGPANKDAPRAEGEQDATLMQHPGAVAADDPPLPVVPASQNKNKEKKKIVKEKAPPPLGFSNFLIQASEQARKRLAAFIQKLFAKEPPSARDRGRALEDLPGEVKQLAADHESVKCHLELHPDQRARPEAEPRFPLV